LDNLTHTLTGLALARAGLNRLSPRATWVLVLAANATDIDVVAAFRSSLDYLDYHRHLTHAFAGMPLVALLPLAVVRLATRQPLEFWKCYAASLIGVLSHILLDWSTIYGMRLWLPFSARWHGLDIISVIDLWIWAALLLSVAAPWLGGLVSSEIGEVRRNRTGRGWAIFALAFLAVFAGARAVLHERAVAVLESRIYQGAAPWRVAAFPTATNPFRWRGLVEGAAFYGLHDVDLLASFDPAAGIVFHKATGRPAMDAAGRTAPFQALLRFTQYPLWVVTPAAEPEGAVEVRLLDLRFGTPRQAGFVATALVDPAGRVLTSYFRFGIFRPRSPQR